MMDRLTDNEIVKILECCVKQRCDSCLQYGMYDDEDCMRFAMQNVLDLINRKDQRIAEYEAEIERLQKKLDKLGKQEYDLCGKIVDLENDLKIAKSEAYREFAERLKKKSHISLNKCGEMEPLIYFEGIDDTLKELAKGVN